MARSIYYTFNFTVPGLADELGNNLKFREEYFTAAENSIDKNLEIHLKKLNKSKGKKKKKAKKKDLILVGIHVR